jgi:hypothetical protein
MKGLWKGFGGGLGGRFVVLRIDHEAATHTFAFAFGVEVRFVAQGEMNDAALARRHGTEMVRSSGAADFFGGDVGGGAKFLDAKRAMILAVETNFFVLSRRKMEHFEREEFESAQEFAAAVEQKRGVGAGEVDEDFGPLPVAIFRKWRIDDDAVFEAKAAVGDDGLEEFVDLIGGGEFVGNGHGNSAFYIARRLKRPLFHVSCLS